MHSPNDTLVRMANDIGNFFRSQGEDRAVVGIADHIKKFWEPRMKKMIFAHLDEGGEGLKPLTLKAVQKLKADMHGFSTMAEAKAAAEAAAAKSAEQPAQQQRAKAGSNGSGKRAR
jgi:formate dehydrogenase subunit delta